MNKVQLAKLDAVIAHVEKHPEVYNQNMFCCSNHMCETKFCIAGHLIVNEALTRGFNLSLGKNITNHVFDRMTLFVGGYRDFAEYWATEDNTVNEQSIFSSVAAKILGIHVEIAVHLLFDGNLTLEKIKSNRDILAAQVED